MKKIIYNCGAGLLISIQSFAQVGIGTSSPNSVLDVNGKTTLRKELRVGGTSTQLGNPGTKGQVLVSQGAGLPPVWKTIKIPFTEEGQYKLINSYISTDQVGINSLSSAVAGDTYVKSSIGDDVMDANKGKWVKIPGLENNITIKNGRNRLTYQFQTGVEMKATADNIKQNVSFTCGVFRNGKLVAVRPDKISTNNNTEKEGFQDYSFTLNYTEQNVPAGLQKIEIACRKIEASNNNAQFTIGRNISNDNPVSNRFILESDFKIDVIEYVTYKSN